LNKNVLKFQKHTKINKPGKYKFDSNKQEKNEKKNGNIKTWKIPKMKKKAYKFFLKKYICN
jgi:hypothetical protein